MITKITIGLNDDQELEVFPDWEGNTEEAVMIIVKDANESEDEPVSFHATPTELKELLEASEFILRGQKP